MDSDGYTERGRVSHKKQDSPFSPIDSPHYIYIISTQRGVVCNCKSASWQTPLSVGLLQHFLQQLGIKHGAAMDSARQEWMKKLVVDGAKSSFQIHAPLAARQALWQSRVPPRGTANHCVGQLCILCTSCCLSLPGALYPCLQCSTHCLAFCSDFCHVMELCPHFCHARD